MKSNMNHVKSHAMTLAVSLQTDESDLSNEVLYALVGQEAAAKISEVKVGGR